MFKLKNYSTELKVTVLIAIIGWFLAPLIEDSVRTFIKWQNQDTHSPAQINQSPVYSNVIEEKLNLFIKTGNMSVLDSLDAQLTSDCEVVRLYKDGDFSKPEPFDSYKDLLKANADGIDSIKTTISKDNNNRIIKIIVTHF